MNGLSTRQPLRLASRAASRDRPLPSLWTCPRCRIHAATGKSADPPFQDKIGHKRKRPAAFPVRHATSGAESWRSAQFVAEDVPEDAVSAAERAESVRDIFELGLANRNQPSLQQPQDIYGLGQALRDDDVDRLKTAILRASEDHGYIINIPKTTWTEVVRRLEPSKIVPPKHRIHRSFNARQLKQAGIDPMESRRKYMETIVGIVRIRREHGIRLDIVDYRLLLQYTAKIGIGHAAKVLWSDMRRDGIQPDVLCYNAYMESIVWDEQSRLRQLRAARSPWHWRDPKSTDIVLFKPGASMLVTNIFNEMVSCNVSANTATFCVLITALARDGELQAAESIISKVWDVDVKALLETDRRVSTTNNIERGSPTYPDHRLLATIADIYGSANQIPAALRLIDHISGYYGIKVADNVWYQISRWTWLQARVKEPQRLVPSESQMQLTTVQQLSNIMLKAPYRIDPNMEQLDILFNSMGVNAVKGSQESRLIRLLQIFELGRARYIGKVKVHREASYQYRQAQERLLIWTVPRKSLDRLRHAAERALENKRLSQQLLQRWCRKLILLNWMSHAPETMSEEVRAWRLRGMPHFLLHYRTFIPSAVKYRIETGLIELVFRTDAEAKEHKQRKPISDRARRLRLVRSLATPQTVVERVA